MGKGTKPRRWRPVRRSEFAGAGCAVQGLAMAGAAGLMVILPEGWLFWLAIGLGGLVLGGAMAVRWVCPVCRNRLDSREVTICPTCGSTRERIITD